MFTRLLRPRPQVRRPAKPRPPREPAESDDANGPKVPSEPNDWPTCGWLDSALDLRAGLVVMEHMTPAAVAHHLPLGWWLHD